ncbi:MAG: endonuclease/exonuclease/phosphatase family protein [Roseiflexaceae bacterium]|nr:endonuclease/exonuclease/phosphatase family protein [Roseiflexaceae bacterium]
MTFNIRGAYWKRDGVNFWPERAALNVATIRRHAPDVIGFQEFQDGNMAVYQYELANYRWSLGPRYGNNEPFEYPAIAWNPAVLRLCGVGGFWLSTTPLRHSESWETACIRSAQWARFQPISASHSAIQGDASFLLLNTHLDHISKQARVEGAKLIMNQLAAIAQPDEPLILTGDFNCDPGTPPYQVFANAGLIDAFLSVGEQDGLESYTFHGFVGRDRKHKTGWIERIDWVLTRGLTAQHCGIIRDENPPYYPSDHYPVLADIELT